MRRQRVTHRVPSPLRRQRVTHRATAPSRPWGWVAAFQAWGPSVLDAGVSGDASTSVARLSSGASVVAWVKDSVLQAQLLDPSGSRVGDVIRISDGTVPPGPTFSIAPLADGEWIATWAAQEAGGAGAAIRFQRFGATGAAIGGLTPVSDAQALIASPPVARRTADGGFVIAWAAWPGSIAAESRAFVSRFGADGARVGAAAVPVSSIQGDQGMVSVSPLSDGSVVLSWVQDNTVGLPGSGYTRLFNTAGLPADLERQVLASADRSSQFTSAPLPGGRLAVAWAFGTQVNWQILDSSGSAVTTAASRVEVDQVNGLSVIDAGDGGFNLLYQTSLQSPQSNFPTIHAQRVNASGAAEGASTSIVTRKIAGLTSTGQSAPTGSLAFSASGAGDGHYVLSYHVSGDTSVEVQALAK